MLGVSDETVCAAPRASSSAPNESSGSSTARRGLLDPLMPLDFQRTLDAAIAVGRWTLRLEECSDLLWNSHGLIVPRGSKSLRYFRDNVATASSTNPKAMSNPAYSFRAMDR